MRAPISPPQPASGWHPDSACPLRDHLGGGMEVFARTCPPAGTHRVLRRGVGAACVRGACAGAELHVLGLRDAGSHRGPLRATAALAVVVTVNFFFYDKQAKNKLDADEVDDRDAGGKLEGLPPPAALASAGGGWRVIPPGGGRAGKGLMVTLRAALCGARQRVHCAPVGA